MATEPPYPYPRGQNPYITPIDDPYVDHVQEAQEGPQEAQDGDPMDLGTPLDPLTPEEHQSLTMAVKEDHQALLHPPEDDAIVITNPDTTDQDAVNAFLKDPTGSLTLTETQKALLLDQVFQGRSLDGKPLSMSPNLNTLFKDMRRLQQTLPFLHGRPVRLKARHSKRKSKKR